MPLAEDAYEQLRAMILTGELPPACALTAGAIAKRLGLGKTPVREAMQRLVLEGFLEVTPRLGYSVTPVTQADVDSLFQLRSILEVAAADLAVERLDDEAIDRLGELSALECDPRTAASLSAFAKANGEFHTIIARGSGNARLAHTIEPLLEESRRFIHLAMLSDTFGETVRNQHEAIAEAFRRRDRTAVAHAVRSHVDGGRSVVREGLTSAG